MIDREVGKLVKKEKDNISTNDKDELLSEVESLEKQIRRLMLEKDILEETTETIKKDLGADPRNLTNKEKSSLIGVLKNNYTLNELSEYLEIARSSYFYHRKITLVPYKYEKTREHIVTLFEENGGRYRYRRIHASLSRKGIRISEKVIRRIMRKANLVVLRKTRRKYNSYHGEDSPAVTNLIERNFHADAPNLKRLTDITEYKIPA